VPYIGLQGPVSSPEEAHTLDQLAHQAKLIGFTSYLTFPAGRHRGDDRDYGGMCRAWCHCFRDPGHYLPAGKPFALLAYSDFVDYRQTSRETLFPDEKADKRWDFAYVCQEGSWKEFAKNWQLARRCLPVLCNDLGLEGVLVGRERIVDLPDCGRRLTIVGELPWRELMRVFLRSRFLFVPSEMDPSPRIIAEALCMDTPVVVNRYILGGWHYVNPFTGAFFQDESDIREAALRCLERWTSPRRWFVTHYGPLLAGARLQRFLASFDPSMRSLTRLQIVAADSLPTVGAASAGKPT
jgi:glycosyltransferase involved in cell wall biosynthesis